MICLHAGVADSRMFNGQHTQLGDVARVISYDRRGFGKTKSPNVAYSQTGDLAQIYHTHDIDAAILLGCSQGGRIAIDFTLLNQKRVQALILIATAISGAPVPEYSGDTSEILEKFDTADEVGDLKQVNEIEANIWLDGPLSKPDRVTGEVRDLFFDMNGLALNHLPLTLENEPPAAWSRLSNINVPVLLLWGSLDFPHLKQRHTMLMTKLNNANGRELANMAHLPNLENPTLVNAEIRGFLQSLPN